jgi:sulfofructose kinase
MPGPHMHYDVLGLGAVALDEFLHVDEYPAADTKVRVRECHVQCGGLTGNALVAAARFGAKCAYAGRLGRSAEAAAIETALQREAVETDHASHREEDGVVKSVIVVSEKSGTRNVFSRRTGLTGARDTEPAEHVIMSARVLLLDHHCRAGGVRAAQIAAAAGNDVVGDFERPDADCLDELLELTTDLIVPASFARARTGLADLDSAVRELARTPRNVTVVTFGAEGFWFVEGTSAAVHVDAVKVRAVDTACCGDVFHGVYAAMLSSGAPPRECLRLASAAAALKATRRGGQQSIPFCHEVEEFLRSR